MEVLNLGGPGIVSFMKGKFEKLDKDEQMKVISRLTEWKVECAKEYISIYGQLDAF